MPGLPSNPPLGPPCTKKPGSDGEDVDACQTPEHSKLGPKWEVLELKRGSFTEGEANTGGEDLGKGSHVRRSHPKSWVAGTPPPLRGNLLVHLGGGGSP